MRLRVSVLLLAAVIGGAIVGSATAAEKLGLKKGSVELKSAGPLAFGPDGVLFIGDPKAAAIYAVDTGETAGKQPLPAVKVDDAAKKAAAAAGADGAAATIVDLAVNPQTGTAYLSVDVTGKGPSILRAGPDGALTALALKDIATSQVAIANAPEDKEVEGRRGKRNLRTESITDMTYVDGQLLVSGLRAGDGPSSVESFSFPFGKHTSATSLEIFHTAHNRVEDNAVVRVFVPININGEPTLLAGFQCTPLVKFPVAALDGKEKVRGTTVAELGNMNRPLDMIAYEKDGKAFLLTANTRLGLLKVSAGGLDSNPGLTEGVPGGKSAGQPYETIDSLKDVVQVDKLDDTRAVIAQQSGGSVNLSTIDLP
jgi:hypothetical protein